MPPVANGPIADLGATLVQQVLTFRSDSGNRMYIITARRMISGLFLKYRKGERLVMPTG